MPPLYFFGETTLLFFQLLRMAMCAELASFSTEQLIEFVCGKLQDVTASAIVSQTCSINTPSELYAQQRAPVSQLQWK